MSDLRDLRDLRDLTRTRAAGFVSNLRRWLQEEGPLPWDHWSRERRQWTALGAAGGLFLLGAATGLVTLWP
jgi:H+/Cl- antiporter ClcA